MNFNKFLLLFLFIIVICVVMGASFNGKHLYVEGNISGARLFERDEVPHMFGLATQPVTATSTGVWYNLTFNETISHVDGNLAFEDMKTVVIQEDGEYLIHFGVNIIDTAPSPSAIVATRIALNGEQMNGSYVQTNTRKQNAEQRLIHSTYDELVEGDRLEMQFISSDTTVSVDSGGTYSTAYSPNVAYGYIEWKHNGDD